MKGIKQPITGTLLSAIALTGSALPSPAQTVSVPTGLSPAPVSPARIAPFSPAPAIPETTSAPAAAPSPMPSLVAPVAPAVPTGVPTLAPAVAPVPPPQNPVTPTAALSEQSYRLGAGDIIRIDSFETPELVLEPRYTVLLDGTVNLPWIGAISVQGKTLKEAAGTIGDRYRSGGFLVRPIITVNIQAPRPLKVGIIGEVNRPGSYIINVIASETTQNSLAQRNSTESGTQWPTVSKAIQTAGGIKQMADIGQIKIYRQGQDQPLVVNLLDFLDRGTLAQDRLLQDGDTIEIPRAATMSASVATKIATSNFSPEGIRVNVVGEVNNPGAIAIAPNSSLNQALLAAGGLRYERGSKVQVEHIRLNPDGTVTRNPVNVDFAANINETNNPALHNNDVIIVQRTGVAKTTDRLNTVGGILNPISSIVNILRAIGL